jgi:hypothetical protein
MSTAERLAASRPVASSGLIKRITLVLVGVMVASIAVEFASSYMLYRFFAMEHKEFHPAGFATGELLKHVIATLQTKHLQVRVVSDHFPVFIPDVSLGYRMNPGDYNITEYYDNLRHMFHLRVDQDGHRATSYVPVHANHRLFITGDSYVFGLGLDDEMTVPWLLQGRMPNDEVVNLSLSSYSSMQALMQLSRLTPKLSADDAVVIIYHPLTNDFNVVLPSMLDMLSVGYEQQLSEPSEMGHMLIPYGALNSSGALEVRHINLSCAHRLTDPECVRPAVNVNDQIRITERAFDDIISLHPGRVIVAFTQGDDHDPVIEHLRAQGVAIADVRFADGDPDAHDVIRTDTHSGPFRQYRVFSLLWDALNRAHMVH